MRQVSVCTLLGFVMKRQPEGPVASLLFALLFFPRIANAPWRTFLAQLPTISLFLAHLPAVCNLRHRYDTEPFAALLKTIKKSDQRRMARPRFVLITFDVDGTLIRSIGDRANHLHKRAFAHAFLEVFGVKGHCDVLPCHGKTDQMIILDALEYYGIPRPTVQAKMKEIMASMVHFFRENRSDIGKGLELLPGVRQLLETLSSHPDVVFGLVTGNLVEIGWMKMDGLGVRHLFTRPNFGGFGSDHWNRGELVNLAARRAAKFFPGGFRLRAHVGDTPADVQAAHFGAALAIGVCTGVFTSKDLEDSGRQCRAIPPFPTIVFPNLANTNDFLCAVGLCEVGCSCHS